MASFQKTPPKKMPFFCIKCSTCFSDEFNYKEHFKNACHRRNMVKEEEEEYDSYDSEKYGPREMNLSGKAPGKWTSKMASSQKTPPKKTLFFCHNCSICFSDEIKYKEHFINACHRRNMMEEEEEYDSYDSEKYGPREMNIYKRGQREEKIGISEKAEPKTEDKSDEESLMECTRKLENLSPYFTPALSKHEDKEKRIEKFLQKCKSMVVVDVAEATEGYLIFCTDCDADFEDLLLAEMHFELHDYNKKLKAETKKEV